MEQNVKNARKVFSEIIVERIVKIVENDYPLKPKRNIHLSPG